MMAATFITGFNRVNANPDRRNPNNHAAFTGFTGLTGLSAHVRVCVVSFLFHSSRKHHSLRAHEINAVNPVTSQLQQGFQAIRVARQPCTTLIYGWAMSKKTLRDKMPMVTAFIDDLREAFGKEMIDGQIRKGMAGEPVFYAEENGHVVGTKSPRYVRIGNHPVTGIAVDLDALEQGDKA